VIGERLGTYTITELLGAGGMGVVYRAYDSRLERDVAIKVIAPDAAANEEARARLLREARTASAPFTTCRPRAIGCSS
jgi:serine/threonine protein kinase